MVRLKLIPVLFSTPWAGQSRVIQWKRRRRRRRFSRPESFIKSEVLRNGNADGLLCSIIFHSPVHDDVGNFQPGSCILQRQPSRRGFVQPHTTRAWSRLRDFFLWAVDWDLAGQFVVATCEQIVADD